MKAMVVEKLMKDIGLPYVYYSWPERAAPNLPYIVYYFPSSTTEAADNTAWSGILKLNIELYTGKRTAEMEEKIETALAKYELPFTRTETFLHDEKMFEVLYEMEVIADGTN